MEILSTLFWAADEQTRIWIAIIVAIGALALVFLYLPLLRRVMGAGRVARALAKLTKPDHPSSDLRSKFEKTVASSFLRDHWAQFKKQWNDSQIEPGANRAPVRWRELFDERPLLGTGARRSMLAAMPGIFLALGILGTFVGLTLSIQNVRVGPDAAASTVAAATASPGTTVSSSDPIAQQQAEQIGSLVAYMGLAFRTSLWGMVLSMISALAIRWLEGRAEALEDDLSQLAEKAYPCVATPELAARTLRSQSEAFDLLRNELTTLGINLGGILERNLEAIQTAASGAAQEATQFQREQMQRLVEEMNETMRAGISGHLSELQSAIASTGSSQRDLAQHLEASFVRIRELIASHDVLAERLGVASTGVELAAAQLSRTAADFGPAVDHLHSAGRSLETTATTIERTQQTAADAVASVSQALLTARENLESQGALVERSLGEIRTSIEGLSRGLSDDLVRALSRFDELLGPAVSRMSGTIHQSNETFDRLATPLDHLLRSTDQVKQVLEGIERSLARIPTEMAPLTESTNALAAENRDTRGMFDRLHKQIEVTESSVSQLRHLVTTRSSQPELPNAEVSRPVTPPVERPRPLPVPELRPEPPPAQSPSNTLTRPEASAPALQPIDKAPPRPSATSVPAPPPAPANRPHAPEDFLAEKGVAAKRPGFLGRILGRG